MVTLTVILILLFVPASRRILSGLLRGILAVLGVAFLITRNPGGRRTGF
jgi:hypothetical protein